MYGLFCYALAADGVVALPLRPYWLATLRRAAALEFVSGASFGLVWLPRDLFLLGLGARTEYGGQIGDVGAVSAATSAVS